MAPILFSLKPIDRIIFSMFKGERMAVIVHNGDIPGDEDIATYLYSLRREKT